ncbi:adenylate kinase [Arthrobacter sp. H5]|uniref:adenylate kinase n=1 Tax=Arthrobacter sp. H5 TaxID=1267973 RepID=UPI0004B1B98D|nr:adenylate kinase [Arthrobacter sp. H5]
MSIPSSPRRVVFFGVTGSGKSTAAQRYAAATGFRYVAADSDIGWLPGWVQRDPAEQTTAAERLAAGETWVFDSFYAIWADRVMPRAQLIVALDYPRRVSLLRLIRRAVRRIATREEICNGNTESLRKTFARDSIIRWHFQSFTRKRERIEEYLAVGLPVLRFRRPVDLERWLREIEAGKERK